MSPCKNIGKVKGSLLNLTVSSLPITKVSLKHGDVFHTYKGNSALKMQILSAEKERNYQYCHQKQVMLQQETENEF